LKSGSLILLELSGPVQACNGIALPFNGYDTDKGQQKLVFTEKEVYRALAEFNP
jgi:hypothetical protein